MVLSCAYPARHDTFFLSSIFGSVVLRSSKFICILFPVFLGISDQFIFPEVDILSS